MKPNHMVYAVLVFGIIMTILIPNLGKMANSEQITYENTKPEALAQAATETVSGTEELAMASSVDLAVATPVVQETKPVVQENKVTEPVKQEVKDPIVYDGLTMDELVNKLNKSLNSTLKGTGNLFAKYALANGVDPYLAVAISLHETGCKWNCSSKVKNCNNVGGMKSGGSGKCNGSSYAYFDTLETGIKAFIENLKINYYDKGLNTPELMNTKYASSPTWASKINSYINSIKNS